MNKVYIPVFMYEGDPIELEGAFWSKSGAIQQIKESLEWRPSPGVEVSTVIDTFKDGAMEWSNDNQTFTIWIEELHIND